MICDNGSVWEAYTGRVEPLGSVHPTPSRFVLLPLQSPKATQGRISPQIHPHSLLSTSTFPLHPRPQKNSQGAMREQCTQLDTDDAKVHHKLPHMHCCEHTHRLMHTHAYRHMHSKTLHYTNTHTQEINLWPNQFLIETRAQLP